MNLICVFELTYDSYASFPYKNSVVGARCVGGKGKKLTKKSNKCQLTSDLVDDVTLMDHTSYESPWSEVCYSELSKSGDHVVALQSNQKKNLKMAFLRHLVNKYEWNIPEKNENFTVILMMYVSWPFEVKRGQMLVKTVKSGSNRTD